MYMTGLMKQGLDIMLTSCLDTNNVVSQYVSWCEQVAWQMLTMDLHC